MQYAILTPQELRELSKASGIHSLTSLALDWIAIIFLFLAAWYSQNLIIQLFCFIGIARQQLALAILMHDGAHRRLFKSANVNDLVCQFLCAGPLFFSMHSYQKLHLKHHRDPLAPDDPDFSLIGGYPISKRSFYRKLLRDISGVSYFKFIRYFIYMARKPRASAHLNIKSEKGHAELNAQGAGEKFGLTAILSSILFSNFLIFSLFWYLDFKLGYFLFWFLPAVTALQVLLRIRGVAEHAGYQQELDQRLNARTLLPSWQTFLFAPHNVNYHIEHHIYPSVPYYRLRKLHQIFVAKNQLPEKNLFKGYGEVLRDLLRE